jgi:4a-hydroxytetrahydrobiopterin dehydratase
MTSHSAEQLSQKKCLPCEGGIPAYSLAESTDQIQRLNGWQLTHDGKRLRKDWVVKHFLAGIEFFDAVAKLAEVEQHHPDLHLESYRNIWIEIWTHAIGGLSENDFILAAKIDLLPVKLRTSGK